MKRSPYRISSRILCVLSALIALMFVLFFLVGYNRYFEEDSQFRAPLLTDALLVFVALVLIGTLAVTAWSVVAGWRQRASAGTMVGRVPLRTLHGGIACAVLVLAGLAWVLGSSEPLLVNGMPFTSSFWLHTADMFVALCTVLIIVTLVAAGCSSWLAMRKKR